MSHALTVALGWTITAAILGSVAGIMWKDLLKAIRERK